MKNPPRKIQWYPPPMQSFPFCGSFNCRLLYTQTPFFILLEDGCIHEFSKFEDAQDELLRLQKESRFKSCYKLFGLNDKSGAFEENFSRAPLLPKLLMEKRAAISS
jgi:hypothetical protein